MAVDKNWTVNSMSILHGEFMVYIYDMDLVVSKLMICLSHNLVSSWLPFGLRTFLV